MKKQVLLLMTGLLFACSGAFAQQEWKELVVNGDFEGSGFSSFSIQNTQDDSSRNLTADDIVVDDNDANNHCAKITLTITPRYCYFIINLAEPLSEGDMFKFSMRAKTSSGKDVPIRTDNMGDIVVKTGGEWSTFTYEGVVSSELAGSQAITLKFGLVPRKNDIFYFDDISMKVKDGNAPIEFADAKVKEICVNNWDTNGDGELSYAEAAAVGDLGNAFSYNLGITSFNELQYFIGLTGIGRSAFSGSSLTSIIIPNNVSYIEQYAFEYCYSLTSLTLGNKVEEIGGEAFELCRSLTSVTIPNSVTTINFAAFSGCAGMTSLTIPKSVTSIGNGAFEFCSGLTSIEVESGNPKYDSRDNCNALIETESNTLIVGCMNTAIPNSVTTIRKNAFNNCSGLTSVTIPNSVTNIEDDAFFGCTSLASIKVESGNTRYDSRDGCNAIIETETNKLIAGCMNTIIPNSVTTIGKSAFGGSSLTSLTIPKSVTSIEEEAFEHCSGLASIMVESGNTRYDSRDNCNAIIETENNTLIAGCMNTIIPNSVTSIGNWAFEGCSGLASITIPNSVVTIGEHAFSVCIGLEEVTIGSGVTKIGDYSFEYCKGLKEIRSMITEPITCEFGYYWLNCGPSYLAILLYVPAGTKEKYEATTEWNIFKDIVEMGNVITHQCPDDNHPHMIDLGLPSGTKWACCNVGASKPEDYGGYFAWGETEEKEAYTSENYLGGKGDSYYIGKNIAGTQYDAATSNWGSPWVMPSLEQMNELVNNCSSEWTTENGVNGRRFTGPNGTSIFLPAAGVRENGDLDLDYLGWGYYWSSSLSKSDSFQDRAGSLCFASDGGNTYDYAPRNDGQSVRPVVAGSSTPSGIAIDETNFPDENFRNWVLAQDYGQDGVLTEEEIAGVKEIDVGSKSIIDLKGIEYLTALTTLHCNSNKLTSLDVSKNTALEDLGCNNNKLTSLDLSQNTALRSLSCGGNQLTSLDVSKNTALLFLWCYYNQLTSLDVSQNTALTGLHCGTNQMTVLDVSNNTALTDLYCYGNQLTSLDLTQNKALTLLDCFNNQLTSLDVSQNTALWYLDCGNNQLTSLDVSQNTALTQLYCNRNQISETEMGNLVKSLPANNGQLYVKDLNYAGEQNVITTTLVAAAKAKGWTVYAFDSNAGDWGDWVEYDGDEPKDISPVNEGETIDIGNEIDENTNLDGNVVGDVYYSISSGDGNYDAAEGCLVVTKPTDDSAIDGQDIFGEDFKDNYTGIVFKLAPGKGSIKVEAETQGNMVLKVKIGNSDPIEMELDGKLKVKFPYNVSEPTYVYIYGGMGAAGAKAMGANRAKSAADLLKIYGFEIVSDPSGIDAIENGQQEDAPVYNLNGQRVNTPGKGVYIKNGRKVLVK